MATKNGIPHLAALRGARHEAAIAELKKGGDWVGDTGGGSGDAEAAAPTPAIRATFTVRRIQRS